VVEHRSLFIQSWRPLANYAIKAGVVCWQVKLCDPHLSALEVRFSRRGATQIYIYLYLPRRRLSDESIASSCAETKRRYRTVSRNRSVGILLVLGPVSMRVIIRLVDRRMWLMASGDARVARPLSPSPSVAFSRRRRRRVTGLVSSLSTSTPRRKVTGDAMH